MMDAKIIIDDLIKKARGLAAEEIIALAAGEFQGGITFASSLGEEDQVILDIIARVAPDVQTFTLDTGRLFQETYELIEKNKKKYKIPFKVYYPDTEDLEKMVNDKGINLFYESAEDRKLCCHVRKIEPLKRALKGKEAWICGLRRAQSITRTTAEIFEWDEDNRMIKVNPLVHWSLDDVRQYIDEYQVSVNPLHKHGFVSIGCLPCTRAIQPGEDVRSGRWWWEEPEQKECGLHNNPKYRKTDDYKNEGQHI